MLCLARADEEATHLTAKLAVRDLDCSVSATEAEMEIPAKAESFAVNAKTTVEIEASSGIAMGDIRNP